jgi:hypothetical protein
LLRIPKTPSTLHRSPQFRRSVPTSTPATRVPRNPRSIPTSYCNTLPPNRRLSFPLVPYRPPQTPLIPLSARSPPSSIGRGLEDDNDTSGPPRHLIARAATIRRNSPPCSIQIPSQNLTRTPPQPQQPPEIELQRVRSCKLFWESPFRYPESRSPPSCPDPAPLSHPCPPRRARQRLRVVEDHGFRHDSFIHHAWRQKTCHQAHLRLCHARLINRRKFPRKHPSPSPHSLAHPRPAQ